MPIWIRGPWIALIFINIAFQIYFFIGATAYFQRDLGMLGTLTLYYIVVPSNIVIIASLIMIRREWAGFKPLHYCIAILACVLLLTLCSNLYYGVDPKGWLYDDIFSDEVNLTSDGKYEYCIRLVNQGQSNRYEQLFVRNVHTSEEKYILIQLNEGKEIWWSGRLTLTLLKPTDESDIYILETTDVINIPTKKFLINIQQENAYELE